MRRENVPNEIDISSTYNRRNILDNPPATKVFTRMKVNHDDMSLDILIKKGGQRKFIPIKVFNENGFKQSKWLAEIHK